MAYNFEDIERRVNQQAQGTGADGAAWPPAPAPSPQRAPAPQSAPARPPLPPAAPLRASARITPDKQLIFGEDVWLNGVPAQHESARGLSVRLPGAHGERLVLSEQALSKHLLMLGGIGSGKTNVFNFLLADLLARQSPDDVIFVFDTKGDFYERFYDRRNPGHVVVGNAPDLAGVTGHWDLFGELEEADGSFGRAGEFAAKELAKQLFEGRESDQQPFFGLAAADLVSKVIVDFERRAAASGSRAQLSNQALVEWFNRADLAAYTALIGRNPDFASAQLYFGDPGQGTNQRLTAQALGVFAYINLMCNDLLHGIFAQPAGPRSFSMRKLVRDRGVSGQRTVVFVEYDLATGEVLTPLYRILFDLALKEALGQGRTRRGNVIFVIDEFKLLPNLMHIDDALNFGRGLGVKVLAGLQSIDQIFDVYGEERGRSILSGFMNAFCFQATDANTRRYVSERFGENRYQLVYHVQGQYQSVQGEGHAIEDWDVRSLPVGTAAVDLLGAPPFVFGFAQYTG